MPLNVEGPVKATIMDYEAGCQCVCKIRGPLVFITDDLLEAVPQTVALCGVISKSTRLFSTVQIHASLVNYHERNNVPAHLISDVFNKFKFQIDRLDKH